MAKSEGSPQVDMSVLMGANVANEGARTGANGARVPRRQLRRG